MNLNRLVWAGVFSAVIVLTGEPADASGRLGNRTRIATRRIVNEIDKNNANAPRAIPRVETVTDSAVPPANDQITDLKNEAFSVLKQTRVAIKLQIVPKGLLGREPKLALKTAIRVETPQLFRITNEITVETSALGPSGLRVESTGSLPSVPQTDLMSRLLEEPNFIVCGADRPGPPVWYVNGILTQKSSAIDAGKQISKHLGRRVHVLHNPTIIESPFQSGLQVLGIRTDDLSESTYDRTWPAIAVGRLLTESLVGNGSACSEPLQGNPTTRQLAWVLYHSDTPVSLVTHSQGCLIARNAFFTMALLGREEWVRDNVAWVAAGIPLNDVEICPRPNRTTILDYRDDPVPKLIGLRGVGFPYNPADHLMRNYVEQIRADRLFPTTSTD